MKLFIIFFNTIKSARSQVYSYVDSSMHSKVKHYSGDGFTIVKETNNCWFLDNYPEGMPKQYRKAEEYKLVNNSNGIYMFGIDCKKLINEWSKVSAA